MSRKSGYSADDLIVTPGGIIESLLRDKIHVEINLVLTSVSSNTVVINNIANESDDYYNGAILVNGTRYTVTDYNGSSKQFTLSGTPSGWSANDNCYLKNINCIVNANSFDAHSRTTKITGTTTSAATNKLIDSGADFTTDILPGMTIRNVTDATFTTVKSIDYPTQLTVENDIFGSGDSYEIYGSRGLWLFEGVINQYANSRDILNKLLYESHSILTYNNTGYNIIPLGNGNTVGTLSKPAHIGMQPQIFPRFTSLLNIYTSFTLNYGYDLAKNTYTKQIVVDKNSSSVSLCDYLIDNCAQAEKKWKVSRKWEYNSDWIKDDNTAAYFIEQMILWLTTQRLIVEYTGDLKDHIQYEKGDKVYIDYPFIIPNGKETAQFMITGKTWSKKKVVLRLFA